VGKLKKVRINYSKYLNWLWHASLNEDKKYHTIGAIPTFNNKSKDTGKIPRTHIQITTHFPYLVKTFQFIRNNVKHTW
jgi:hypothetical protein